MGGPFLYSPFLYAKWVAPFFGPKWVAPFFGFLLAFFYFFYFAGADDRWIVRRSAISLDVLNRCFDRVIDLQDSVELDHPQHVGDKPRNAD